MNVLSLCDVMSCCQIALWELGLKPNIYYASEIDKHAIRQTQLNFPNTIQLGDMAQIDVSKLERIDLLAGGTPCTNFSFAGKRNGMTTVENEEIYTLNHYLELKSNGFKFEGESYLFWEFVRILRDVRKYNPNVLFLLENVEMGKKWERVLSEAIGLRGVHINSALVSAQNRKRIYWTNIRTRREGLFGEVYTDIPNPSDRGILLSDILEKDVASANSWEQNNLLCVSSNQKDSRVSVNKSSSMIGAMGVGGGHAPIIRKIKQLFDSTESAGKQPYQQNRIYSIDGVSPALMSRMSCGSYAIRTAESVRRLTPTECARLQTIPEWYKWDCSDTQMYKMLGNGWTIEVIKHIFSFMS